MLALYAAKTGSHGGDMHLCITQQTVIDLALLAKLSLLGNQYKEMNYKIERAEDLKQYTILSSQVCSFYSTIWEQCTERLQARLTAQAYYHHIYSRQDS